jgi:hypothetical protein
VPAEIFFRRARSLSPAHARHAGPTTGPRTAAGTAPCRPPPWPHDGTAHCRRHRAVPPTSVSPPRPRHRSVLAGFAASTLAPSAPSLFELTASCRSPRRRPSPCDAAATPLAYKRSEAVTNSITSPSTPSRFTPLAEPLLTSPAHSRDEAPTVDPIPRAVARQGEMAGSPDH